MTAESGPELSEPPIAPPPIRTLDEYLAQQLPNLTSRERRRLVARGGVKINDAAATAVDVPVGPDDRVQIAPIPQVQPASSASAIAGVTAPNSAGPPVARAREPRSQARRETWLRHGARIVHEDRDLLVVDKPTGMVTADPTRMARGTLFDLLKEYARARGTRRSPGTARVWIIHRLDKEASGLLVFAKSEKAFEWLKEDFRARRVQRLYYAVVEGIVGPAGHSGTHQSFLQEDTLGNVRSLKPSEFRGRPGEDARLAVTHYRVIASKAGGSPCAGGAGGELSLLQVRLETGRKNQIRIHMADLGHPLAGDRKFGASADPLDRLGLHAAELGFRHPATGLTVRYSSPAPASFWRCVGAKPPGAAPQVEAPAQRPNDSLDGVRDSDRNAARGSTRVDTSWDRVANWYDEHLDDRGDDNYERIILPGTLSLLRPSPGMRVLDVACGQGILARRLTELGASVTGVDASPRLIEAAKRRAADSPPPDFRVADACELASLGLSGYDAAACVMSLGNIDPLEPVIRGIASALRPGGALVAVIAHPAFRAPGQTSWEWDAKGGKGGREGGRQYRRVDGYLSPGQHAIQMHPGSAPDVVTWTFHRPLQTYVKVMTDVGLLIESLEEWPGQRLSTSGPRAAEENRARREIPLFLGVRAVRAEPHAPARGVAGTDR